MKVYRGDLEPDMVIELYDDTAPLSLAGAEEVRLIGVLDGCTTVIDRLLDDRPVDGVLTVPWQAGETDTAGQLVLEVEVTWPGAPGRPQTFRPPKPVTIVPDLG